MAARRLQPNPEARSSCIQLQVLQTEVGGHQGVPASSVLHGFPRGTWSPSDQPRKPCLVFFLFGVGGEGGLPV
jgi:hypothetical protein